jgi:hypothetical protein
MKKLITFMQGKHSLRQFLPFAMLVMAFMVTGCPHKDYTVQLEPHGNVIKRTLVFFCADGVNSNNIPNYQTFDAEELAAITALYPINSLTTNGGRYSVQGDFTNEMPNDVGGAGVYTNLLTTLGEAGFYVERFRGNDDLAGMTERQFKIAGHVADLIVGWSHAELGQQPGYDKLHQFLDVDFRRDLKNLTAYWWEGNVVSSYKTNASEEFAVRFGQYLLERGYFTLGEMPRMFRDFSANNSQALLPLIQRLVAREMGVPDTEPVPASLAFLGDQTNLDKSFTNYLAGTDEYQAKLKQWDEDKKLNPNAKQPDPSDVVGDLIGNLVDFDLFGGNPDHLAVRLSLPSPPVHSNGRWDAALKQVVWESDIVGRTNATQMPLSCYASWVQPAEDFQTAHLGKVALTGDDLTEYCLWRSGQDAQRGGEWDSFIDHLKPGTGLMASLDAFRFSGEPDQTATNDQQIIPSAFPRELLKNALK